MAKLDPDKSGYIETGEFLDAMIAYITHKMEGGDDEGAPAAAGDGGGDDDDDGDEEDAEVPEDLAEMGWEEQQAAIKKRSLKLMGAGLLLVLVFSDPMVDVMNNMGARVGVPPFYVAFILAPLASNASEFIASYNYAAKKTKKTITVALAALEGAACMNNTFCLAIFMALVFFRGLAWRCAPRDACRTRRPRRRTAHASSTPPPPRPASHHTPRSSPHTPLLPLQVHGGDGGHADHRVRRRRLRDEEDADPPRRCAHLLALPALHRLHRRPRGLRLRLSSRRRRRPVVSPQPHHCANPQNPIKQAPPRRHRSVCVPRAVWRGARVQKVIGGPKTR